MLSLSAPWISVTGGSSSYSVVVRISSSVVRKSLLFVLDRAVSSYIEIEPSQKSLKLERIAYCKVASVLGPYYKRYSSGFNNTTFSLCTSSNSAGVLDTVELELD